MGTSSKTTHSEGVGLRKSRILFGILITAIVALGAVIWDMKVHQIDPAQDPNWVALTDVQQLQKQLDQEKKKAQEQQHRNQQLTQQISGLQRQIARQTSESEHMIPLSRLPQGLQGDSVQSSLDNILKLQHQVETPHTDSGLILSYFAILEYLQAQGVINTAEPASDDTRQSLYSHIQTALKGLGVTIPAGELQPQTYETVKRFQAEQKLKVDGKIGMQTFMAMVRQFQHPSEISSNEPPPMAQK